MSTLYSIVKVPVPTYLLTRKKLKNGAGTGAGTSKPYIYIFFHLYRYFLIEVNDLA